MKVTVYGPGCARCKQTEKIVRLAVEAAGVQAEVEKVSDFQALAKLGILTTPAVAIDGVVKSKGRIPNLDEVSDWITCRTGSS